MTPSRPTGGPAVRASHNGPYLIDGPIALTDADGTSVSTPPDRPIALCRCGASANKPLCDGSHASIGFDGTFSAANRAPSP